MRAGGRTCVRREIRRSADGQRFRRGKIHRSVAKRRNQRTADAAEHRAFHKTSLPGNQCAREGEHASEGKSAVPQMVSALGAGKSTVPSQNGVTSAQPTPQNIALSIKHPSPAINARGRENMCEPVRPESLRSARRPVHTRRRSCPASECRGRGGTTSSAAWRIF